MPKTSTKTHFTAASDGTSPQPGIRAFLIHLRLHYQFFILSGPYLLGGVFGDRPTPAFFLHFFTVHILLFGGVTAYNSFWDKDDGPIGGLKRPPPMAGWMLPASWALQVAGLALALGEGIFFAACYGLSMLLFWLYSSPRPRFKGKPWASLFAIGLGTGFFPLLMGYLAALEKGLVGFAPLMLPALAGMGATLLLVSLYPLSQAYQIDEDLRRGDVTFASRYGLNGVRRVFTACFFAGTLITAWALFLAAGFWGPLLGALSAFAGLLIAWRLRRLQGIPEEYSLVMNIKYAASLLFVLFLCGLLLIMGWQA